LSDKIKEEENDLEELADKSKRYGQQLTEVEKEIKSLIDLIKQDK
jgi:hypothetical protein